MEPALVSTARITFVGHERDEDLFQAYARGPLRQIAHRCRWLTFGQIPEQRTFHPGVYVLAGHNRLDDTTRAWVEKLWRTLDNRPGFVLLNHPRRTLGRLELLRCLHAEGLNDFTAYGAWEDLSGVRYPAFVRDRSKDGGSPHLLHSRWQVDAKIGRALLDGRSLDQLIVVEFQDTSGESDRFAKYSAFKIGSTILPVSVDSGTDWVMRNRTAQFTRESVELEREYVLDNPHADVLERIFELAGVEYGRIDYSLLGGRLQTWEINTLPSIDDWSESSPVPKALQTLQLEAEEAGYGRLCEVWSQSLEQAHSELAGPVPFAESPGDKSVARPHEPKEPVAFPKGSRLLGLRRSLGPLKAFLYPLIESVILPVCVRVFRTVRARRA